MIGRAPEQAVREGGDGAVRGGADLEVAAVARFQEIRRDARAAVLDPEHVAHAVGALEVVHRGVHPGRVGEGRMVGDVGHPLLADIDRPPVADTFEILLTRAQHRRCRPIASFPDDVRTRPARTQPRGRTTIRLQSPVSRRS